MLTGEIDPYFGRTRFPSNAGCATGQTLRTMGSCFQMRNATRWSVTWISRYDPGASAAPMSARALGPDLARGVMLLFMPLIPMGLGGVVAQIGETLLQGGDRVLFYTDGIPESKSAEGEFFGTARLAD